MLDTKLTVSFRHQPRFGIPEKITNATSFFHFVIYVWFSILKQGTWFSQRTVLFISWMWYSHKRSHLGNLHPQNWFQLDRGPLTWKDILWSNPRMDRNQFCGCRLPRCESTTFIGLFSEKLISWCQSKIHIDDEVDFELDLLPNLRLHQGAIRRGVVLPDKWPESTGYVQSF